MTTYILNESDSSAVLIVSPNEIRDKQIEFLTWDIIFEGGQATRVKLKSVPTSAISGIRLDFEFKRQSSFLMRLFIIPSLMFTLLAYTSFYIDQGVPPARVTLCITNVLNSISLLSST